MISVLIRMELDNMIISLKFKPFYQAMFAKRMCITCSWQTIIIICIHFKIP